MNKDYYYQHINHYALVIDVSGSVYPFINQMIELADKTIDRLREKSVKMNQETRLSIYTFSDKVECVVFDVDVTRLGSLAGKFRADGRTALMDGIGHTIDDLETIPTKYGDHAYVLYIITDGEENASRRYDVVSLRKKIEELDENWTLSVLVPNRDGVAEAKRFGIPAECIETWDVTKAGLDRIIEEIGRSSEVFMEARTQGIRGMKGLLKLNLKDLDKSTIKANLQEVDGRTYRIYPITSNTPIKDFVEKVKKTYVKGLAYYQLTKTELVQHHKEVLVFDRTKKKLYRGASARQVLNLPDYDVKVNPELNDKFDIFIQSTSVNRKLVAGQNLVLLSK